MKDITLDKLIKDGYDESALNAILGNSDNYTRETLFNVYLLLKGKGRNVSSAKIKMLDEKFSNEGGVESYTKEYLNKNNLESIEDLFNTSNPNATIITNNSKVLYPAIEKLFTIFKIVNVITWLLFAVLFFVGLMNIDTFGMAIIGIAIFMLILIFFQYLTHEFVRVQVDVPKNTNKTNELLQKLLDK